MRGKIRTPSRVSMKRLKNGKASSPVVTVEEDRIEEFDWTPDDKRLYPRRVAVRLGETIAVVEEERDEAGGKLNFFVGIGDEGGDVTYNIMGESMSPSTLDTMLQMLTIARDKAKELGMPDDNYDRRMGFERAVADEPAGVDS